MRPDGKVLQYFDSDVTPESAQVRAALARYGRAGIPYLDTTECSIEEIASRILDRQRIERRVRV